MKTSSNYAVRVLATGFIVLVFFTIAMFCGRFIAEVRQMVAMPQDAKEVEIEPSGLLPEAVEFDPNVVRRSIATARIGEEALLGGLGLVDYAISKVPGGRRSDFFHYGDEDDWMYFDRTTGQIVFRRMDSQAQRLVTYYAGSEGVSDALVPENGRFSNPMITRGWRTYFVFDARLRRFFSIDLRSRSVRMGPPLEDSPAVEPVRIGFGDYSSMDMNLGWRPPMKAVPRDKETEDSPQRYDYKFTLPFGPGNPGGYIPVIDASGRVDLLDSRTLNLVRGKGALPVPKTLYGHGSSQPGRLLDYGVQLAGVGAEDPEYIGMVVGSLSRQGTSMALAVFDAAGRPIKGAETVAEYRDWRNKFRNVPSAKAVLFGAPWAPALTIFRYLLENAHPPLLSMASFFAANGVDARASRRALFLLPNSFVAMHRDRGGQSIFSQLAGALWTMTPAFLLAGLFAWRVVRDASVVGLSSHARIAWLVATLAFGLPAYLTYRLTRPQTALVTCANCGRPRRPDMERCHRCNSPWRVPELVPPAWCVLDGGLAASSPTDASEKSTAELEQNPGSSVELM
jgi:hypothetical protein